MTEQVRLDRIELATVVQRMLADKGVRRIIIEADDASSWRVGAFDLAEGFDEEMVRAQILSLQASLQGMYALAGHAAEGWPLAGAPAEALAM